MYYLRQTALWGYGGSWRIPCIIIGRAVSKVDASGVRDATDTTDGMSHWLCSHHGDCHSPAAAWLTEHISDLRPYSIEHRRPVDRDGGTNCHAPGGSFFVLSLASNFVRSTGINLAVPTALFQDQGLVFLRSPSPPPS